MSTDTKPTLPMLTALAQAQGMDAGRYWNVVKATVLPANCNPSNEQVLAVLAVANQYNLNPLTKQIYAFPGKSGGVVPIVSVDGWLHIANSNPQFDGMETEEVREGGEIVAVTCRIYRKDRSHPVTATEYMIECKRATEPWKQWPVRMLTNKAMIQAIRRAFSLSGIVDPDEADRIKDAEVVSVETAGGYFSETATSRTEQVKLELAQREPGEITQSDMDGE